MVDRIINVKNKLDSAIDDLCKISWMFSTRPGKDFTRARKLPFRKVVSFMLAMEGGPLTNEMLKHFGCSATTASSSALLEPLLSLFRLDRPPYLNDIVPTGILFFTYT